MKNTKLIFIGGFLGAGKTTAIAALGDMFRREGKTVAVITNDQTEQLVDTALLRKAGFPVGEVTSGCFCCHFHSLEDQLEALLDAARPDVILAEPVGSCTDLLSTVIKPFSAGKATVNLDVAPLSVLVDARRLLSFRDSETGPFQNPEVSYVFFKQLEEAEQIILSKADLLSPAEQEEALAMIEEKAPGRPCLLVSAKEGEGMDRWRKTLLGTADAARPSPAVDYDIYAAGEAALAWLNCAAELTAADPFSPDAFLTSLCGGLYDALSDAGAETAHLKACLSAPGGAFAKVSCTGSGAPLRTDAAAPDPARQGHLTLNLRVNCAPETAKDLVLTHLEKASRALSVSVRTQALDCFAPAYPNPVFRM